MKEGIYVSKLRQLVEKLRLELNAKTPDLNVFVELLRELEIITNQFQKKEDLSSQPKENSKGKGIGSLLPESESLFFPINRDRNKAVEKWIRDTESRNLLRIAKVIDD